MLKEDYKIYEGKMKKSIDSVAADFASRAGGPGQCLRAGPDHGGLLRQPHPIQQIAAISSPTPGHC